MRAVALVAPALLSGALRRSRNEASHARARALCLIARSARCDVRWSPPSSSNPVKLTVAQGSARRLRVSPSPPAHSSPLGLVLAMLAPFVWDRWHEHRELSRSSRPAQRLESLSLFLAAQLQPLVAFEAEVERDHDQQHDAEDDEVAVAPAEFGHVVEVHAVDSSDKCRDDDDSHPA